MMEEHQKAAVKRWHWRNMWSPNCKIDLGIYQAEWCPFNFYVHLFYNVNQDIPCIWLCFVFATDFDYALQKLLQKYLFIYFCPRLHTASPKQKTSEFWHHWAPQTDTLVAPVPSHRNMDILTTIYTTYPLFPTCTSCLSCLLFILFRFAWQS